MKKRVVKTILTLAISVAMIVPMLAVNVKAEVKTPRKYVALGDSIAYGLSAEKGQGYVDLVTKELKLRDNDVQTVNLAHNGDTTSDLLKVIMANQAQIAGAEVVTISIGGNNFLKPTIAAIATAVGVDPNSATVIEEIKAALPKDPVMLQALINNILTSKEYNDSINKGLADLQLEFPQIIAAIKTLSPQAKIYVNNLYNAINNQYNLINESTPILGALYAKYEALCNTVNAALLSGSTTEIAGNKVQVYNIVNVYSLFKINIGSINFDLNSLDPHPTTLGHKGIAQSIISVLDFTLGVVKPEINVSVITSKSNEIIVKTKPGLYVSAKVMPELFLGAGYADVNGEVRIPLTNKLTEWSRVSISVSENIDKEPLNTVEYPVLDVTPPTINIEGVKEGVVYTGSVKPKVILDSGDKVITSKLNGELYNFEEITKDGIYKLIFVVSDEYGNQAIKEINFEIKKEVAVTPGNNQSTGNGTTNTTIETGKGTLPETGGANALVNIIAGLFTVGAGSLIRTKKSR